MSRPRGARPFVSLGGRRRRSIVELDLGNSTLVVDLHLVPHVEPKGCWGVHGAIDRQAIARFSGNLVEEMGELSGGQSYSILDEGEFVACPGRHTMNTLAIFLIRLGMSKNDWWAM